ncbi:MAG TPA: GDCCVxC domain-containing (seleno)protein [Nitrospira sp.]|nr:GDCCVxC domain-containing (seleno)protein [Nitrospira sp.]
MNRCVVQCPNCGMGTEQEMSTDSCVVYFQCPSCKAVLRPKTGQCCVFCSYGNVKCPSAQLHDAREHYS